MLRKFPVAASRIQQLICCVFVAVTLAACGGGGGTSSPAAQPGVLTSGATSPPPIVNGTPPTSVVAGAKYDYVLSASDAGGRPLSFDITNPPEWATFSTATGELS